MYKRITLRIVTTLADNLKTIAKQKGISFNSLVCEMVWEFVENWNTKYRNIECSDTTNLTKTK